MFSTFGLTDTMHNATLVRMYLCRLHAAAKFTSQCLKCELIIDTHIKSTLPSSKSASDSSDGLFPNDEASVFEETDFTQIGDELVRQSIWS